MRCLVGVSGGLDSFAACVMLKEKGFDVVGLHLKLTGEQPLNELVKERLRRYGVEIIEKDAIEQFNSSVVEYFIDQYAAGLTPNPCVVCNKEVKIPLLAKAADDLGIYLIATGHYAAVDSDGYLKKHRSQKDQSYFLACVDKNYLKRMLFPLENTTREEIEKRFHLELPKSSDLCFVKHNYRDILAEKLGRKRGRIVKGTQVVGYHDGFFNYTIGQRKGIKVGNVAHYVTRIDANTNTVYVNTDDALFSDRFELNNLKLYIDEVELKRLRVYVKVRFSAQQKYCKLDADSKRVYLFEKERAITPGQIAVFYDDKDRVVACGTIGKWA